MDNLQTHQYEMLLGIRVFGDEHSDLFPASSPGGQLFTKVGGVVDEIDLHAVAKMSAYGTARDGAAPRAALRAALRRQLDAISRTGRVIAEGNPELADRFLLPDERNDQALLTAARLVARDAAPHEPAFVASALPATFLADFSAAIGKFEEALRDRNAAREDHLAARKRLAAALASGMAVVKKLDVLVANRLRDDPATLAVWQQDRRIGYGYRGRAAATATGTTAVPPATASAPDASTGK